MDTERVNTEVRRERSGGNERRGFRVRRAVALVVYVAGGLWALGALQASLSALWARDFAVAGMWLFPAVAGWWLTVGVGIRLGVSPRDFLAWLAASLGFSSDRRHPD